MKVENGHTVHVHYRGTFEDGTEFDNSRERGRTLDFQVGSGQMIPGFDSALVGMTAGEQKSVSLSADEAYGPRREASVQAIPKTAFAPDFEFEVGRMIQGNGPRGPFVAKVEALHENEVVLDFNHPLAGKNINFEIELVSIVDNGNTAETPQMANWSASMKKAELLEVAKQQGLKVNTRTTKAQIIAALESAA
tara:strand:- start:680 stop:1258 length:579 start_codon:yes stop_codon:yes gene_type:complete